MDSQNRAAFEDIEFLAAFTFGNILQKPWLPLTAGVIRLVHVKQMYSDASIG